jgi:hypothetical protein
VSWSTLQHGAGIPYDVRDDSAPSARPVLPTGAGDTDQSLDGGVRDLQGDGIPVSGIGMAQRKGGLRGLGAPLILPRLVNIKAVIRSCSAARDSPNHPLRLSALVGSRVRWGPANARPQADAVATG